jgi:hypothetical protein
MIDGLYNIRRYRKTSYWRKKKTHIFMDIYWKTKDRCNRLFQKLTQRIQKHQANIASIKPSYKI